jgi:hemoglobin
VAPPTLYEWAGGQEALERLTETFYSHVREDELLAPVFAHMDEHHPHYVAMWLGEVFGGPDRYTQERGGYPHMLGKHRGLGLREDQRFRWAQLMLQSADEAGLPADPEFRSAFAAYIEWGTRLALANSQPGAAPPPVAPVPRWGWGEAPPYEGG